MKKICIIGQGYIGIPTAFVLAERGFNVIGVDKDKRKIELLQNKKLPFHEQEFSDFAKQIFDQNNYQASLEIIPADVYIICVPTPFTSAKTCDFVYVNSAAESIAPHLKKGDLVILESTVPPKTCEDVLVPILSKSGLIPNKDFLISHAPERLLPGNILHEIIYNDRIIGGLTDEATQATNEIYKTFSKGEILLTDATTAEMSKVTENTYRDVNIALANELTLICEFLKINPHEVISLANHHPRVNILSPGPGVGGHCIPIDPWFIVEKAPHLAGLIRTSRERNDEMPHIIANKLIRRVVPYENPKITIFGAAYKPNVDDPRESPTKYIIHDLKSANVQIALYDPLIKSFSVELHELEEAVNNSDLIAIIVNHDVFKKINPKQIKELMRHPNLFVAFGEDLYLKWQSEGFKVSILGKE